MSTKNKIVAAITALLIAVPAFVLAPGLVGASPDVETPADVIHPNIHDKVGNGDGTNANPNGANDNGGNIHGIANVPGKQLASPNDDGVNGFANELNTVHGGISNYNPQVDD